MKRLDRVRVEHVAECTAEMTMECIVSLFKARETIYRNQDANAVDAVEN